MKIHENNVNGALALIMSWLTNHKGYVWVKTHRKLRTNVYFTSNIHLEVQGTTRVSIRRAAPQLVYVFFI